MNSVGRKSFPSVEAAAIKTKHLQQQGTMYKSKAKQGTMYKGSKALDVQREKSLEKLPKKKMKLDPVGSTVRYEMMKLCTRSVEDTMRR